MHTQNVKTRANSRHSHSLLQIFCAMINYFYSFNSLYNMLPDSWILCYHVLFIYNDECSFIVCLVSSCNMSSNGRCALTSDG